MHYTLLIEEYEGWWPFSVFNSNWAGTFAKSWNPLSKILDPPLSNLLGIQKYWLTITLRYTVKVIQVEHITSITSVVVLNICCTTASDNWNKALLFYYNTIIYKHQYFSYKGKPESHSQPIIGLFHISFVFEKYVQMFIKWLSTLVQQNHFLDD